MQNGLRSDVARAFENARAQVSPQTINAAGLSKSIAGWIDAPSRFIAPDAEIGELRLAVLQVLDAIAERADEAADDPKGDELMSARLVAVLSDLERATLDHGRANELADRVGLGTLGRPI